MSRFAFISQPTWGHVDFGGRSFARTAGALVRRGHQVTWFLVRGMHTSGVAGLPASLEREGVAVEWIAGSLSFFGGREAGNAVANLAAVLRSYDACAIDRVVRLAAVAAHKEGLPWASMGTDGTTWMVRDEDGVQPGRRPDPDARQGCRDLSVSDYPLETLDSVWLISPFLNLSYLPAPYYSHGGGQPVHFVGDGDVHPNRQRSTIVATLGASSTPGQRWHVYDALDRAQHRVGGSWRVLGHDARLSEARWQPYDTAFADARVAIGPGGNAFLWQAMTEGIPVIVLPSRKGDLRYAARTALRLGIGMYCDVESLTVEWLTDAVVAVTTDDAIRRRSADIRSLMRSGGGVAAAATLLERLARERAPVWTCAGERCCCTQASATEASTPVSG